MGFLKPDPPQPPPPPDIDIPEPDDPGYILSLDTLLNRISSSGPYGRETYGRWETDPETGESAFVSTSDEEWRSAIAAALSDPQNPDIGALISLWPNEVVVEEDPRQQQLRMQGQDTAFGMTDIAQQYMGQIGGPGSFSQLPQGGFAPGPVTMGGPPQVPPPPAMGGGIEPPEGVRPWWQQVNRRYA